MCLFGGIKKQGKFNIKETGMTHIDTGGKVHRIASFVLLGLCEE